MASWTHDPIYKKPKFKANTSNIFWDPQWWIDPEVLVVTKDWVINEPNDWVWGRPNIDIRAICKSARAQAIAIDRPGARSSSVLQHYPENLTYEDVFTQMINGGYKLLKLQLPFQFDPAAWNLIENPLANITDIKQLDAAALLFRATEIPLGRRVSEFLKVYGPDRH